MGSSTHNKKNENDDDFLNPDDMYMSSYITKDETPHYLQNAGPKITEFFIIASTIIKLEI